jgi:hypothetical protein
MPHPLVRTNRHATLRRHRIDAQRSPAVNTCLVVATVLAVLVGVIHSVLGERLIFRHQPRVDRNARRHRRPFDILWATWHIASVLGLAMAAVLWKLAAVPEPSALREFLLLAIALAYAASGVLVLVGTRGRHPGWAGLIGVAVLVWLA